MISNLSHFLILPLSFVLIEPHNCSNAASPAPTPDQQRIRALVELLASKNTVTGKNLDQFPKGYDKNAQVVVYLAIQQLLAEGSTAFDTLIEHFNDERYCYTFAAPDDNYNTTVGDACASIMLRCIKCYSGEIYTISEEQYDLLPVFGEKGIADWWKYNRHRPLWEIQVDNIDHAVALMEKVCRDKTKLPWRMAEQLTPEVFESRREYNLRILKGMRASIVAQKEAYRPKSLAKQLDFQYDVMIGLPWPTAPHRP
jgi:hypothetical protein